MNSNLGDLGISQPAFSRTNLKIDFYIIPKMFRNITDLDSSKTSGPMVVLKNCKLELSYILAYFFKLCLKESCFSDC